MDRFQQQFSFTKKVVSLKAIWLLDAGRLLSVIPCTSLKGQLSANILEHLIHCFVCPRGRDSIIPKVQTQIRIGQHYQMWHPQVLIDNLNYA